MKQTIIPHEHPEPGSLDEYRAKGENNPDIAVLVAMIDRMRKQGLKLAEALAEALQANARGKGQA